MTDSHLESLYQEAKSALKARDYEYAIELLKRVLVVDENYKDTSRLLEKAVRLRKLHWYKNPRLWGTLGLVVVFVLGFVIAPRIGGLFANPATTNTISPIATNTALLTATPTSPSTVTPTRTPRPTPTATPIPAWVTDFAEPILAAIKDREPDFQDDFSTSSGGWKVSGVCEFTGHQVLYKNGEVTIDPGGSCWVWRDMWYPHFVAEVDARFVSGASSNSRWTFNYRHVGDGADAASNGYQFHYNGDVTAILADPTARRDTLERIQISGAAFRGLNVNHMLIIAKDQTFALYVNDRPVFYKVGEPIWPSGGFLLDMDNTVALDNLKIWDISDMP